MTPADIRATLARLGLSQAEASRVFGVSDRAVRTWVLGERTAPEPVVKLLRLMVTRKVSIDDVRDA